MRGRPAGLALRQERKQPAISRNGVPTCRTSRDTCRVYRMSRDMRADGGSDREAGRDGPGRVRSVPTAERGVRRIDLNARATLSLSQAAEVLGVHRSTAWELYKRGEFPLPVLQVGHRLLVTKVHLERFLLTGTCEGSGEPS